jgi:hypothetical protein
MGGHGPVESVVEVREAVPMMLAGPEGIRDC